MKRQDREHHKARMAARRWRQNARRSLFRLMAPAPGDPHWPHPRTREKARNLRHMGGRA